MTIADMDRNNLEQVEDYYEAEGFSISYDDYRLMMRLQDDSTEFEELTEGWVVIDAINWWDT